MKTAAVSSADTHRASKPPLGISVNNLSLGVLAGLCIGQGTSAAQLSVAIMLAAIGFVFSIAASKLIRHLNARSKREAHNLTIWELERRLERLIPQRHIKAHGMHSHRPHSVDECESNWMPVVRQSRVKTQPR